MSIDLHINTLKEFHQLSDSELSQVTSIKLEQLYKEIDMEIPNRIYACTNLRSLCFERRKTSLTISPKIVQLQQLESLKIINCPITKLPQELSQLSNLKILKCEETLLKTIPGCVFKYTVT